MHLYVVYSLCLRVCMCVHVSLIHVYVRKKVTLNDGASNQGDHYTAKLL